MVRQYGKLKTVTLKDASTLRNTQMLTMTLLAKANSRLKSTVGSLQTWSSSTWSPIYQKIWIKNCYKINQDSRMKQMKISQQDSSKNTVISQMILKSNHHRNILTIAVLMNQILNQDLVSYFFPSFLDLVLPLFF